MKPETANVQPVCPAGCLTPCNGANVGCTVRSADAAQEEEVGACPWCGETGIGFADSERPRDYCGHDPALIRPRSQQ